ncbi:MAG: diguanylate cyclase [gamma proteobacterium symbiont of Taylorina sp.]|nr:diguanylate cyclase [gamma proteobacterium symbiont of Taylorina sp.]
MSNIVADKILIVDDKPANISLLTTILEEKGYHISAANSGEQAIVISNKMKPDLILLDIMMPGIDGYETCRRLKQQVDTKTIPVIFISAKSEIEDVLTGFTVGAVDYINKPFYKEEVCARIKSQLQIQSLNLELISSELKMGQLLTNYQHQSERLQQIVDHVASGIIEIDHSGKILFANIAVEHLFGYKIDELERINFFELLAEPFSSHYQNKLEGDLEDTTVIEIMAKKNSGNEFPIDFSLIKISVGKEVYMAVIQDVTTRKEKEEELRHLSNIDPLTKLVNRRYFEQQFKKEWQRNQRDVDNQNQLAFFMIDIDFFKQFNDTYGHQAGDVCLIKVATSIINNTRRSGDIVARLGGEEFGVIITESSKEDVIKLAEQIRSDIQALKIPHSCSEYGVVTISLGGVFRTSNDDCDSCNTLYNKADQLMYQAKKSGKNQCIVV